MVVRLVPGVCALQVVLCWYPVRWASGYVAHRNHLGCNRTSLCLLALYGGQSSNSWPGAPKLLWETLESLVSLPSGIELGEVGKESRRDTPENCASYTSMVPLLRRLCAVSQPSPFGTEKTSENLRWMTDHNFMLISLRTLQRCHLFLGKVPWASCWILFQILRTLNMQIKKRVWNFETPETGSQSRRQASEELWSW